MCGFLFRRCWGFCRERNRFFRWSLQLSGGKFLEGPSHRMISSVQEVIMIIAMFICCMCSPLSSLKLPMVFLDRWRNLCLVSYILYSDWRVADWFDKKPGWTSGEIIFKSPCNCLLIFFLCFLLKKIGEFHRHTLVHHPHQSRHPAPCDRKLCLHSKAGCSKWRRARIGFSSCQMGCSVFAGRLQIRIPSRWWEQKMSLKGPGFIKISYVWIGATGIL